MTDADDKMACLIRHTAEKLWDVSETILSSGQATEDDWELARLVAGILLVELQRPPEQGARLVQVMTDPRGERCETCMNFDRKFICETCRWDHQDKYKRRT